MLVELACISGVSTAVWYAKRPKSKRRYPLIDALTKQENHQLEDKASPAQAPLLVLQRSLAALQGQQRQQQMQEIAASSQSVAITPEEQAANRNLAVALGSLATITIGNLGFPLLVAVGAGGILSLNWPLIKACFIEFRQHRKLSPLVLYPLLMVGAFAGGLFFEAAVGISTFQLARKLLARTRSNSRRNLVNIMGVPPTSVWVMVDGTEVEIPFDVIDKGDVLVIYAGQTIPIDGVIVEGHASIDQRSLTGEAQPAEKRTGDAVLAATTVLSGKILVRVEKTSAETVAAQIGTILNNSADYELSALSRSDRMVEATLLPTLGLSALALPVAGIAGSSGVLLSSFGYNLRILSPISMLNFLQAASEQGILIKDGRSFELLQAVDTIVFDKTGTLTLEQPHVAQVHAFAALSADEVLNYAAAAEARQTHPIAKAILAEAAARNLVPLPIEMANYELGYGLKVKVGGSTICVGSDRFMALEEIAIPPAVDELQRVCHAQGYSLVMVALNGVLVGAIELHPTVRPEARQIVNRLKAFGLDLCIISGDQEAPTQKLADELGIERYFANTLPENKARLVKELQADGKSVCFVGDGINDAIALRAADVSISLRGATLAATDTAQIVFMNGDLSQLPALLELAQRFDANMDWNMRLSVMPGVAMLGGVFLLHLGLLPVIGIMNLGLAAGVVNAMLPAWRTETTN